MIHLFHGEDSFESYHAAKAQAAKIHKQETGSRLVVLEADELEIDDFARNIQSTNLFGEQSIVLAKRLLANSRLSAYLEKNLDPMLDKQIVIWHDSKADGRTALVKGLKQKGEVTEFAAVKEWLVADWVQKRAKLHRLSLTADLASTLVEYVGVNKWKLESELQKLRVLQDSQDRKLDKHAVLSAIGIDKTGDVWKYLDYLSGGQKGRAIKELERLYSYQDNTQYLISMLNREVWLLARISHALQKGLPLSELKLHPFVLKKLQQKAARFNTTTLKRLAKGLLRVDLAIKQGRVEPVDALFMYTISW